MTLFFSPNRNGGGVGMIGTVVGPAGSQFFAQASAPSTDNPANSLWLDTDSTDLDLYQLSGGSWTDTGVNLNESAGAIRFNFNTATTDSDKDAGDIWFDNATPASVTTIYFDNTDRDGNTVTTWLDGFDDSTSTINGQLILSASATPSLRLIYNVTGSVTDGTGYRKVAVTHVSGTTLPSDNAQICAAFVPVGDKGDTGADAVIPATAFNFNTATTDSDKDAGDIWFDNATPASVTTIYFDNADRDANTVTSWLDAFDDSTATIKGTLTLVPALTPSAKLIYNVTGSVVDGTGYRKVTVTHVAGTTLPSNDANIAVAFSRTGDDGVDGEMAGPGVSVDSEIALFDGIGGATLKRATGSGLVAVSSGVFTGPRTLTAPAAGITVSNGDGVSGNPTLALADDLAALEGMSSTGLVARTASNTYSQRTVTAGTGISLSNGDGVSGNPTVAMANMAANTFKANNTGSSAAPSDITVSQAQALLAYPIYRAAVAVNFNAANTDHAITINSPTTNYRVLSILIINNGTTASLTTATGGLFTGTGGGGTTIFADGSLSSITSNAANTAGNLTGVAGAAVWLNSATLYWRTGTAQGAAASGYCVLFIQPLF